jgi:hypothetical protein
MNRELINIYIDMLKLDGMVMQMSSHNNTFWYTIDADNIRCGCFAGIIQKYYTLSPK